MKSVTLQFLLWLILTANLKIKITKKFIFCIAVGEQVKRVTIKIKTETIICEIMLNADKNK